MERDGNVKGLWREDPITFLLVRGKWDVGSFPTPRIGQVVLVGRGHLETEVIE